MVKSDLSTEECIDILEHNSNAVVYKKYNADKADDGETNPFIYSLEISHDKKYVLSKAIFERVLIKIEKLFGFKSEHHHITKGVFYTAYFIE